IQQPTHSHKVASPLRVQRKTVIEKAALSWAEPGEVVRHIGMKAEGTILLTEQSALAPVLDRPGNPPERLVFPDPPGDLAPFLVEAAQPTQCPHHDQCRPRC